MKYKVLLLLSIFYSLGARAQIDSLKMDDIIGGEVLHTLWNGDSIKIYAKNSLILTLHAGSPISTARCMPELCQKLTFRNENKIYDFYYAFNKFLHLTVYSFKEGVTELPIVFDTRIYRNRLAARKNLFKIEFLDQGGVFIVLKEYKEYQFLMINEVDGEFKVEFLKTKIGHE